MISNTCTDLKSLSVKNGAEQTITDVETLIVKLPDGKRDTDRRALFPSRLETM